MKSFATVACALVLVLAVMPLGARTAHAQSYNLSAMTVAQKEALVKQLIEILRTLLAARGVTLDESTLFDDAEEEHPSESEEDTDEDEARAQDDEDEASAEADELEEELDDLDYRAHTARAALMHLPDQAVGFAYLNSADDFIERAEEYLSYGEDYFDYVRDQMERAEAQIEYAEDEIDRQS